MGAGLFLVRWRRARAKLPQPSFKAWHVAVIFNILINLYAIVMPWYPPRSGIYGGDVSFFYATYLLTGIGLYVSTCSCFRVPNKSRIVSTDNYSVGSLLARCTTGHGFTGCLFSAAIACAKRLCSWRMALRPTIWSKFPSNSLPPGTLNTIKVAASWRRAPHPKLRILPRRCSATWHSVVLGVSSIAWRRAKTHVGWFVGCDYRI